MGLFLAAFVLVGGATLVAVLYLLGVALGFGQPTSLLRVAAAVVLVLAVILVGGNSARSARSLNRRLRAAEAARRSFVGDLAHELRTPLAIIRGQAEGIADGVYPGDAEHMAPILDATRSLELLVDDLANLALNQTGGLALRREPVDLAVLVNDTLVSFQPAATAKGVKLIEDVAADVPAVDADPARLRGVLGNLLANAIRHTPAAGSVRISARASGETVQLKVADDGEGIPPDLLPRVFDRFTRAPGSPGSGLGLAIAREVVQAHGGVIDLTSEVGKGTTVRVELPAWKRNAASGVVEAAPG